MFEAGLAGVRRQSKAQIGDKTMMDALLPAVDAIRQAADAGKSIKEALQSAAEAAENGAVSTKEFQGPFRSCQESWGTHHWAPGSGGNINGLNFSGIL